MKKELSDIEEEKEEVADARILAFRLANLAKLKSAEELHYLIANWNWMMATSQRILPFLKVTVRVSDTYHVADSDTPFRRAFLPGISSLIIALCTLLIVKAKPSIVL